MVFDFAAGGHREGMRGWDAGRGRREGTPAASPGWIVTLVLCGKTLQWGTCYRVKPEGHGQAAGGGGRVLFRAGTQRQRLIPLAPAACPHHSFRDTASAK